MGIGGGCGRHILKFYDKFVYVKGQMMLGELSCTQTVLVQYALLIQIFSKCKIRIVHICKL